MIRTSLLTTAVLALSACATSNPSTAGAPTSSKVAERRKTVTEGASRVDLTRDRKAILQQAGNYQVSFRFQETVPIKAGYEPKKPYLSKATEFVEVIENTPNRISLQHVLEVDGRGVVKHWRQTWVTGENKAWVFLGNNTWRAETLPNEPGLWHQLVYQVDDSPRYAGSGRWTHEGGVSSWASEATWRPLPRREYTKRSDYQVLVAVNRHTLTPNGWVHEQDNRKGVLGDDGQLRYLVREVGLNTYTRSNSLAFEQGRSYWKNTAPFWQVVRAWWQDRLEQGGEVHLAASYEEKPMYMHMFEYARDIHKSGKFNEADARRFVDETLSAFVQEANE